MQNLWNKLSAANAPIKNGCPCWTVSYCKWVFTTLKCGRSIGSKDKNPQIRKEANLKYDPSEDMKILKRTFDIIDLSVPEELIKYLKVMKIKRSRRIMS